MAISISELAKKRAAGQKLTMVTAYDATFARLVDDAGIDIILVGDSLGHVVQGRDSTLAVTLDEMIYHCRCVMRACTKPFVVGDMPFGSYQVNDTQAVESAIRIMKEGGVHAVKLEGGQRCVPAIRQIVAAGIPVMGHLGLTPQSVHQMSGYRVQGKSDDAANELIADAQALAQAGAFSIVLEGIPRDLAKRITEKSSIPIIGIGAGPDCDGQVLVLQDLLGLNMGRQAKFVRNFAKLGNASIDALQAYSKAVQDGSFPADEESYH